jgi:hypothetical protein
MRVRFTRRRALVAIAVLFIVAFVAYSYWPERTNLTLEDYKRVTDCASINEAIAIRDSQVDGRGMLHRWAGRTYAPMVP